MKKTIFLSMAMATLIMTSRLEGQTGSAWIHIRVTEHTGGKAKVSVNLPLSVVQVALDLAPEKILSEGHVHIDHGGRCRISVPDLRRMWKELRDSGETEFVTVEDGDGKVVVTREGDLVRVEIVDPDDAGETVHIGVPVTLVDALLSGEGKELNVREALDQLKDQRGEIVRVEGGDADVRIWIDERN